MNTEDNISHPAADIAKYPLHLPISRQIIENIRLIIKHTNAKYSARFDDNVILHSCYVARTKDYENSTYSITICALYKFQAVYYNNLYMVRIETITKNIPNNNRDAGKKIKI